MNNLCETSQYTVDVSVLVVWPCFCHNLSISQLSEARDKTLEGLKRKVDYRELKGKDHSNAELVKKIEQVPNSTVMIFLYIFYKNFPNCNILS